MKAIQKILATVSLIISTFSIMSGQGVGIGTSNPDPSAILELKTTITKPQGLLIPRITTFERSNFAALTGKVPANSLLVFDTDTESFWFYNTPTSTWEELGTGGVGSSNLLIDSDNDTKIDVDLTSNGLENNIHFYNSGIEHFKMLSGGKLSVLNSQSSIYIGENAGLNLTSGQSNIAFGDESGNLNQTGNQNVLIGVRAGTGTALHNKNNNVMIGYQSGQLNEGSNNTFVGFQSGQSNTGVGNVFVGNLSGAAGLVSNKLFISNTSDSSPLLYGDFNTDSLQVNGSISIGDNLGNHLYRFPVASGSANQIMINDGTGNMTWTDLLTDNLGNHVATQNIQLNGNYLSGDGDNEGISITNAGNVGIGVALPNEDLEVKTNANATAIIGDAIIGYNKFNNDMASFGHNAISGATGNYALLQDNAGRTILNASGSQRIEYRLGGSNRAFLDPNGFTILEGNSGASLIVGRKSGAPNIESVTSWLMTDGNVATNGNVGLNYYSSGDAILVNGGGNVGIGTTSPLEKLHISNGSLRINDYTFPSADGTANQLLSTDGSGTLTWQDNTTDDQGLDKLNLNGSTLEISLTDDGVADYTVDLSSLGDDLGNHIATQNIQLTGNYLSGDGDNEGISVTNSGNVGIGILNPTEDFEIKTNTNATAIIGDALIGFNKFNSDMASFGHNALSGIMGNYALLQDNAGRTILNASTGQKIEFRIGGNNRASLNANAMSIPAGTGGATLIVGRASGAPNIESESTWLMADGNVATNGKLGLNYFSSGDVILANGGGDVGINTPTPNEKLHLKNGNIKIENGHLISSGATAPGISAGTISGNDISGKISINSNSTVNITFATVYDAPPSISLTPANSAAATATYYITNITSSAFDIVTTGGVALENYNYMVIQY